MVAQFNS